MKLALRIFKSNFIRMISLGEALLYALLSYQELGLPIEFLHPAKWIGEFGEAELIVKSMCIAGEQAPAAGEAPAIQDGRGWIPSSNLPRACPR